MQSHTTSMPAHSRLIAYLGLSVVLFLLMFIDVRSHWGSNAGIHTIMEVVATLLALMVGTVALFRYYSSPSNHFLFIGTAFLGAAFLDGYHAVVTSVWLAEMSKSIPGSLIPWSWLASRQFLSIMLLLALYMHRREIRLGDAGKISPRAVYLGVGLFTLTCFLFFFMVPLPPAYFKGGHFLFRPQEYIPAGLFLLTLIGYLRDGRWRNSVVEHWIVLALIANVCGQLIIADSEQLYDPQFDLSHVLKKTAYVCTLIGLLFNMLALYRQADLSSRLQQEIAERQLAQEALQRANQQLLAIFDGVEGVIYVSDPNTYELLYVNPSSTDESSTGLLGSKCHKVMYGLDRPCSFCTNDKIFGTIAEEPYVWDFKNESTGRWFRCVDKPIRWVDGSMVRFEFASDITEQKLAEDERIHYREYLEKEVKQRTSELQTVNNNLKVSMQDLESFSYSVSHDLRAPLRAIDGFIAILVEDYGDKLDTEAKRLFNIVRDNARKMGRLIDDILAFSRAGRFDLKVERLDMNSMVDEVWADLADERRNRNIEFIRNDLMPAVGDSGALRQVWHNLLSNAIKFSRMRPVAHIVIESRRLQNGMLEFSVRDDGIGFNPDYSDKLFVLFQRLHGMDEFEGTGVGLSLVKRFIQKHQGEVEATGQVDGGATFQFRLPDISLPEPLPSAKHEIY